MTSNPSEFGVAHSQGALAFIVVAAVVIVGAIADRSRRNLARLLGLAAISPGRLRSWLGAAVALLLACAITRPYWGVEDITVEAKGYDVIFLVDISRSMYASDIPPSRLEVAKRKMKDLVATMTSHGEAARFGITVFAGAGYTVCPITTDRGVLNQFIDLISPDLVTSLGSNLKAGIEAAISKLDDTTIHHSRVILLSDGEDNFLDAQGVVSEIRAKGVRFDVLGVGTLEGSAIDLPSGSRVLDQHRKTVMSSLREEPLRAIAQAGGGTYVRVTLDDRDIASMSGQSFKASQRTRTLEETSVRSYREYGPWITLAALVTLLIAACRPGTNPLLALLIALLALTPTTLHAETPLPVQGARETDSPFALYEAGDYSAAASAFERELQKAPHDRILRQGLASALYKLGQFERSEEIFSKLAGEARSGRHYFESVYNQGNSLLKLHRFQDAVDAFMKALDVKPDDEQSHHNLEVARALLEEQKRRELEATPTPTNTPTSTSTSETTSSPTPPSPSPNGSPNPAPQTPDSGETGQQTPQPTPGATGHPTEAAHGTPHNASTTSPGDPSDTPPPETTPALNGASPTPAERLKESLYNRPQDADPRAAAQPSPPPVNEVGVREVDAWLQSLPDSPLLIRRQNGGQPSTGQTW